MRKIPERPDLAPTEARKRVARRRSLTELLTPLESLATHSTNLVRSPGVSFACGEDLYELPRYHFIGPRGGGTPIRIGLFAGIHGDEPEGAFALVEFGRILEQKPELATGYCLSLYPLCNPTGFEDNTRHSRSGKDLNREFWVGSVEPEIRLLEIELLTAGFHGLISLHVDKDADGFYGVVRGATLAKHLIEPALGAAEAYLPPIERPVVAGFQAQDGIIQEWFKGSLSAPPNIRPRPFEIALATPKAPPAYLRQLALVAAVQSILNEYRGFIAHAPNL